MYEVLVYVPETDEFIVATEGSGDNLLPEDIEDGYVDYVCYTVFDFDGYEFNEIDGGMILLEEYFADTYKTPDELAEAAIDMHFLSNLRFDAMPEYKLIRVR